MNFLEFFWIYLSLCSIVKVFKLIKNMQKKGIYRAGPTWMRRGMQGDEKKPRGRRFHTVLCQKYFQTYQFDENYSNWGV